jgi:hopanoid biosynthesis associated RND transporter like protein HpnN
LAPAKPAIEAIHALAGKLRLTPANGLRVRLTGSVPLEYDQMKTVTKGAWVGSLLSLALVLAILIAGFGSSWLVFTTLITLLVGLIFTAAFATFAVGKLNSISVGFAILYIGLGVEYAVHYCLGYKDFTLLYPFREALCRTGKLVGVALIFSAFTSAIGFYAFIPTPYSGIAELGLIVGTGMFISAALSLTFLPAMLSLVPLKSHRQPRVSPVLVQLFSISSHYPKVVAMAAGGLAIAAILTIPKATFDNNPVHLQDPNAESVRTYNDLLAETELSPLSIVVLAKDAKEADKLKQRLKRLKTVDEVVTLEDFVPEDQEDKLAIIEEIALVLGPKLTRKAAAVRPDLKDQKLAIVKLLTALKQYLASRPQDPLAVSAARLYRDLARFKIRLDNTPLPVQRQMIDRLERDLVGSLPGRLRMLQEALAAEPFSYAELPADLVKRWRSADGQYRIEVFPRENLNDNQALRRFVNEVRTVAPNATEEPVILTEASTTVIEAFQQALMGAFIAITVLLTLLVKRKIDVLLGLAPILLAGILTVATTVVLGIPFNFANIITLPLIFGICIDNSIHIMHRYHAGLSSFEPLFNTSAVRGVILCAMTNIAGLGNLAASAHRGTASMGIMLTIGILFSLLTSLVVLPSLLKLASKKAPA